ncbi:MAG: M20/M25/M40 family metallo-hydrolase, partial [Rhizobiales bacterium]|nr:M20/M25/M40 family metallo-hydrolase [Hyphomicrobiales bacterium]
EASPVSDMDDWPFKLLMDTVGQVFPDVARAPGLVLGATDSRHYREITGNTFRFTPLRFGAKDLARIHGTNERISIANYAEIIQFYGQLFRNLADFDAQAAIN